MLKVSQLEARIEQELTNLWRTHGASLPDTRMSTILTPAEYVVDAGKAGSITLYNLGKGAMKGW